MKTRFLTFAFVVFFMAGAGCSPASDPVILEHVDGLGSISFPTSGAPEAQDAFIRGVLLLHSFEFGPAAAAFREAQAQDSSFVMAYWGEAMTYNHPLWRQVDVDAARGTLARLAPTPDDRSILEMTDRERMYLEAVEALYSEGTKSTRDTAYMDAMARLHKRFPKDDEATAFYALSILGSTNGERDFEVYERAAATVKPVFERNPDHPGAAHYIIHSYDDPAHAENGLAAANAYSDIAPNAAHAQHMTTHIFVALGMWDRVVENNIRAMRVQNAARAAAGRESNHCGHYSSWRHYAHLQLGQTADAEALMNSCFEKVRNGGSSGEWSYFADMRALHIIDTEDWSLTGRWLAEPPISDVSNAPAGATQAITTYRFSNALGAIRSGNATEARRIAADLPVTLGGDEVLRMELEGLLAISDGNVDTGIEALRQAAEKEASYPLMFGPPTIVKPAYELLGEELLESGRRDEAVEAFERALGRTPGRRDAVKGAQAAADAETP